MANVNPIEYGATFPARLDPGVAPELVAAFVDAEQLLAGAEAPVICDDGVRLFGLAAGEAAVHDVTSTPVTSYVAQSYAGRIDA
jgi:hypothetical protein